MLHVTFPVMPDAPGHSDEDIEAQLTADEAAADCGLPMEKVPPETGIAQMQARIAYLERQGLALAGTAHFPAVQRQLADARARLREFQTQRDGRN